MSGSAEFVEAICAGCSKTLYGAVRHCPFCGARQAGGTAAGIAPNYTPNTAAVPLTPLGTHAEVPGMSTPREAPHLEAPRAAVPPRSAAVATPGVTPPAPISKQPSVPAPRAEPAPSGVAVAADAISQPGRSGSALKWILMLVLAGSGYAVWEFMLKPKAPDACQLALDGATASMQANQFAQAKTQAVGAVASCAAERLERAKIVLKAAESAQASDDSCGKALRLVDSQIADGRLKFAQRTLDAQPGACLNGADAASRKQRIDANKADAAQRLSQIPSQVSEAQFDLARKSIDEAERLDRDNADLARIRKELETKAKEALAVKAPVAPNVPPASPPAVATAPAVQPQVAATPAPSPAPKTLPQATQAPPTPAPAPQVDNTAENNKRLECAVLVKAGQRALANSSYDEAMQSAQEARAAIASCPGAQELFQSARQAKDKARERVTIQ